MTQEKKFYIDILSDYKNNFKNHLDIEDNYRTIFSGIFGIGKTTFLKDFFELEEVKQEYEVIHLFPVNYSIATNEDIFELIKFDIFYQLLSKNIEFDIESIDMDIVAYQFIKDNFKDIIFPFLSFIPSVGGSIEEIAEKCLKIKKKFTDFNSSIQKDELEEIKEFLKEFSEKKGTIYENDFYSQLITSLIYKLKDEKKKVVLIIDDLDRIDPEHIFRLLNIFSAHTDIKGDSSNYNKFDFDRVVFVCDINNIRSIYQAKFGIYTDFNGYIDKFYSRKIFNYNITDILSSYTFTILDKLDIGYNGKFKLPLTRSSYYSANLTFIIEQLFLNNSLSLRDLNRVCGKKIKMETYELVFLGSRRYTNQNFSVIQFFDILLLIYGNDKNKLLTSIANILSHNTHPNINLFLGRVLSVILLPEFNMKYKNLSVNDDAYQTTFRGATVKLKEVYSDDEWIDCQINNFDITGEDFNYFKLLYLAFESLKN